MTPPASSPTPRWVRRANACRTRIGGRLRRSAPTWLRVIALIAAVRVVSVCIIGVTANGGARDVVLVAPAIMAVAGALVYVPVLIAMARGIAPMWLTVSACAVGVAALAAELLTMILLTAVAGTPGWVPLVWGAGLVVACPVVGAALLWQAILTVVDTPN